MENFQKSAETEGLQFCKNILAGEETNPYTKADWFAMLKLYSEERYTHWPTELTAEKKFSMALDTDFGRTAYQVMKWSPGLEVEAAKPEPSADVAKATAAGPAGAKMIELFVERRKTYPHESPEQAYVAVYLARENAGLKDLAM